MARIFDLAIVGCGGVSQMHFDGYARHPERVRIAAACDPEIARARAAAERWGFSRVFSSLEEMMAGAEWDVAVVCTPTPVREPVIASLAAAGKPIFVEKPLADSFEEARRMVATCEEARVPLAVDQNFRYHYPFDQARVLLAEGRIGRVHSVFHQDLFFRQDRGWRMECPRHALSVMGIHWLDGFRWILQDAARSLNCSTYASTAIECAGETDAFVQVVFEKGANVVYVQSFSSPFARTETLVFGETGMLRLGYDGLALIRRGGPAMERWENPYAGTQKPESTFQCLEHLLTALETGAEMPNSGRDNLGTVALLDAAYRSAATHQPVRPG